MNTVIKHVPSDSHDMKSGTVIDCNAATDLMEELDREQILQVSGGKKLPRFEEDVEAY